MQAQAASHKKLAKREVWRGTLREYQRQLATP